MWPALKVIPTAHPLKGVVEVPGSKSSGARLLIAAALADGESLIRGLPRNDDIEVLIAALVRLGIGIESDRDCVKVTGQGGRFRAPGGTIDIHRSGTALRFLLPLIAMGSGAPTVLDGDSRLRERPVKPLVEALCSLGCLIETEGAAAPVAISPAGIPAGGAVSLDATVSSQFISALLLVGPLFPNGLTLNLVGAPVSRPYLELTIEQMRRCGVAVEKVNGEAGLSLRVSPQKYRAAEYVVPPDASTASYFWAIGGITNGEIAVRGLDAGSREPDMQVAMALAQMGGGPAGGRGTTVGGRGKLRAITVDGAPFPDGAITVAGVAAFADGETRIGGLRTLRFKESDRLSAVVELLTTLGVGARVEDDALFIRGGVPHGGRIKTHNDHRLAMIGGVFGARVAGVEIEAPHVVRKSCPEYWRLLASLGVRTVWVTPPLVALVGFMGAGKSTVATLLGRELGIPVLELDEMIREKAHADSIAALFEQEGEAGFREREHLALQEALRILRATGGVISTGGGVVERSDNTALLSAHATVVHLNAQFGTIAARLGNDAARPLWRNRDAARALFESRASRYRAVADLTVDTDALSASDVARVVGELWCEGVGL